MYGDNIKEQKTTLQFLTLSQLICHFTSCLALARPMAAPTLPTATPAPKPRPASTRTWRRILMIEVGVGLAVWGCWLGFGMQIFWSWERLMLRWLSTHRNPRCPGNDLRSRCCQKQWGEGEEDGLGDGKSFGARER